LEKIATCNRSDQHLGEAQDLQKRGLAPWRFSRPAQREPAPWKSSRPATERGPAQPATEGTSILEKLKTCNRGYQQLREAQDLQQRVSAP
jgi:hypothetical protein